MLTSVCVMGSELCPFVPVRGTIGCVFSCSDHEPTALVLVLVVVLSFWGGEWRGGGQELLGWPCLYVCSM